VPKPSHLRSVDPIPAPAAQGGAPSTSGASVAAEPPPLGSRAPTPQGGAPSSSGASVAAEPPPLGSRAPTPQGAASRSSGASVETLPKRRTRRSFTAGEKLRIVREAAACTKRGDVEALLRREGIYSSLLRAWRKQLQLHGSDALAGRKPGRKPKHDAKDRRIAELEKKAARLEARLSLAEKLIDLQKKVSAILGISLTTDGER
jgi:transposase